MLEVLLPAGKVYILTESRPAGPKFTAFARLLAFCRMAQKGNCMPAGTDIA